jgi:hypothetical protein
MRMDASLFRNRRSDSESLPNGCRWIECALCSDYVPVRDGIFRLNACRFFAACDRQ